MHLPPFAFSSLLVFCYWTCPHDLLAKHNWLTSRVPGDPPPVAVKPSTHPTGSVAAGKQLLGRHPASPALRLHRSELHAKEPALSRLGTRYRLEPHICGSSC